MAVRGSLHGWIRSHIVVPIILPTGGTSAIEILTDLITAFGFDVEQADFFIGNVAGAGASASRTLRVLKGASTVAATGTLTEAGTATRGAKTALTVTDDSSTNRFAPGDTLTVDFADGGTTFSAGQGFLIITIRQQSQTKT